MAANTKDDRLFQETSARYKYAVFSILKKPFSNISAPKVGFSTDCGVSWLLSSSIVDEVFSAAQSPHEDHADTRTRGEERPIETPSPYCATFLRFRAILPP
jgi:hypothetical protein